MDYNELAMELLGIILGRDASRPAKVEEVAALLKERIEK